MGKTSPHLSIHHQNFIRQQKMFFVATAPPNGFINLSPKGMDSFRIINENKVVWLNLTGSGNETAAHLLEDDRMTIMMNAFDGNPMILRIYGKAKTVHQRDHDWEKWIALFDETAGARQIFVVNVDMVQTSCGFGVPIMEFKGNRPELANWTKKKGEEGLRHYHLEKNTVSLNGKTTGLIEDLTD